MQNPFDELEPDPRAVAAAQALMRRLPALDEGKMFGVLVAEGGEVLHAFSGDAALPGFVPHVYDTVARAQLEPAADAAVKALGARLEALDLSGRDAVAAALGAERERLEALHAERRRARQQTPMDERRAELSRADKRERRHFEQRAREALAVFAPLLRRRAAIERLRRLVSQEAMRRIHDTYVLTNALGESTPLRALFDGREPPWGAGECAAVKLLPPRFAAGSPRWRWRSSGGGRLRPRAPGCTAASSRPAG